MLPGAVAAAIAWQLLRLGGESYVTRTVKHASDIDNLFALVLGLIAFLYAAALIVVVCAEANAVRADRLSPRARLTPLTDNVELTPGDEKVYAKQAAAQRSKGFEQIDVSFDNDAPRPWHRTFVVRPRATVSIAGAQRKLTAVPVQGLGVDGVGAMTPR